MPTKKPTMQDVARKAGVSTATVSRVLAGVVGAASDDTCRRVRQVAGRLGYVVNGLAAGLRSQQSSSVGLILADVSNPFFGQIASGIEQTLTGGGYGLILGNTSNRIEDERRLLRLMMEKQVDAIVLASSAAEGSHIHEVLARGMPLVLVDTELPGVDVDAVVVDNRAAAKAAVEYLLDDGHLQIAIVTGALRAAFDRDRLLGYQDAFAARGLRAQPWLELRGDSTTVGGRRALTEALQRGSQPTAVFVTNNLMTTGAIAAILGAGLEIPGDISILGFDDMDWYPFFNPSITAIAQPAYEIGCVAGQRLLERLNAVAPALPKRFVLDTRLVVRGSTARPAPVPRNQRFATLLN
jgi:LacI family transcriptional regulator